MSICKAEGTDGQGEESKGAQILALFSLDCYLPTCTNLGLTSGLTMGRHKRQSRPQRTMVGDRVS